MKIEIPNYRSQLSLLIDAMDKVIKNYKLDFDLLEIIEQLKYKYQKQKKKYPDKFHWCFFKFIYLTRESIY